MALVQQTLKKWQLPVILLLGFLCLSVQAVPHSLDSRLGTTHFASQIASVQCSVFAEELIGEDRLLELRLVLEITLRETGDPIAYTNPFRFSTKYVDIESEHLNYGYRLYNPTTGRWLSKDPIEVDGGLNLYGFVGNNGINHWDILGLDSDEDELDKRLAAGKAAASYFYYEDTASVYGAIDQRAIEQGLWVIDVSASIAVEFNLPLQIVLGAGDLYSDPSWFHVVAMLPGVPRMPGKLRNDLGLVIDRYGPSTTGGAAADKYSRLIARVSSKLDLYPCVVDQRTGRKIAFPSGIVGRVEESTGELMNVENSLGNGMIGAMRRLVVDGTSSTFIIFNRENLEEITTSGT